MFLLKELWYRFLLLIKGEARKVELKLIDLLEEKIKRIEEKIKKLREDLNE